MGDPVHGIGARAHRAQRPQCALAHHQRVGGSALDEDGLGALREPLPAGGATHAATVGGVKLHLDQVKKVAVGIGITPGHVAIAAHGEHRWRPRQRQADQAARLAGVVAVLHRQPVPGGRQLQSQVHVVGDDGAAAGAARAGQRPVVAADGVGVGVAASRWRQRRRRQRARRRRWRWQRPCAPPGWRRGRQRRRREVDRLGIERGVEGAGDRQQKGALGGVAVLGDPAARQFARFLHALQIDVHGPRHQHAIGRLPRPRRARRQHVFERLGAQRVQAVVDAVDVTVEKAAVSGRHARQQRLRACAKAVQPVAAIARQRLCTEQLGELAGARAAHQVHLEEAFLGVDEAGGIGEVDAIGCRQQRHATGIARHRDDAGQPSHLAHAVELGQAGPQHPPGRPQRQHHQHADEQRGTPAPSFAPSFAPSHTHVVSRLIHRSCTHNLA